jgi:hypothetical protein
VPFEVYRFSSGVRENAEECIPVGAAENSR